MMRKVLLWRQVYVGMSPVVAVPVLWRRGYVYVTGGGCASVAAPSRCVANVAGVCVSPVVSPVVCVSCVLCRKCGWLSGQTYKDLVL
jgi:hypothetical protein